MNTENEHILQELKYIGFEGELLIVVMSIVTDQSSLEELKNFIILKGDGMTQLLLVNKFVQHMQEKRSYRDYGEFAEAYEGCTSYDEKVAVIAKLLALKRLSLPQLKKVVDYIDSKAIIGLNRSYVTLVKYRKLYTADQIVTLIECS